jgi:PBP1b-binding outer membrane lipoprotein LpoB
MRYVRRKITAVFLIAVLCMMGCSSKMNPQKADYMNNIYNSVQKIDQEDSKDVKKDNLEMVSGKIKKITMRGGKRSLLIEDIKGMEYIFHINEHTIVMTFEKLKIGQNVDIIFNGILTRSIPPQGNAIIVNGLKV